MRAELEDGRFLEFPEGTDPAVVQSTVKRVLFNSPPAKQETAKPQPSIREPSNIIDRGIVNFLSDKPKLMSYLEKEGGQGSKFGRLVQGAADLPVGAMQLGMNMVGAGGAINPKVAEIDARTQALRGPDAGFDFYRLLGGVANPVPIMGLANMPIAAGNLARMAQGAGLGAGFGAAAPVSDPDNYWSNKAGQVGAGAVMGGAIPPLASLVSKVGGIGRNVIDPLLPGGVQRSAARLANTAAGPNRQAVISELQAARQLVPGSAPNAGQAAVPAGSAEFSALQKAASDRLPSEYFADDAAQQAARLQAVRSVGQTPQALAQAVSTRAVNAAVDYGAAYQAAIKADPALAKIASNPFVKDAIPDAAKLAEASGINAKTDLTEFLHLVKLSLDKQLMKTGESALSNTEKMAVAEAKSNLLKWMGSKNPAYETARANFAAASKPINQMQVGQYLENKLASPMGNQERAGAFTQAVRDAPGTIKRALTGAPRFDNLSDVLTPPQTAAIGGVTQDLQRNAQFERLAAAGRPQVSRMIGENIPQAPPTGMFKPILSAARSWVNRLLSGASDDVMRELAVQMRNPQQFAQLMQAATPQQRQQIADAIIRYQGMQQGAIMSQAQPPEPIRQ